MNSSGAVLLLYCFILILQLSTIDANIKYERMQFSLPSPLTQVSYVQNNHGAKEITQADISRRTSQSDSMKPLRIKFYVEPLLKDIQNADALTKAKGNTIIQKVLPQIETLWSESLSVVPSPSIVLPQGVCFELFDYPSDWSDAKKGLPDADLLIFVSGMNSIGSTELCSSTSALSTLAVSSPCAIDPVTDRPVVGFANVCLNMVQTGTNGLVLEKSIATMVDVMSHELAHVLGMNSELYKYFRNSVTGKPLTPRNKNSGFTVTPNVPCVGGQDAEDLELACENTVRYGVEEVTYGANQFQRGYYEIVLPTVAQVARNHFNCQSLEGARLENQPTSSDCLGSHFDERTWFTEFMSAVYDDKAAYFSPLTLAFLEDTGWYKSNFQYAHNSPFGLGAGCQFVHEKCIVDDKVPDYGKGYFCNDVDSTTWSCGPSHRFRATCDLKNYVYPGQTYFEPSHMGPSFTHADFCPLILSNAQDCDDTTGDGNFPFEVFGDDSRCMELSVGATKSAVCLKSSCNHQNLSYDFEVANRIFSCTQDFQIINVAMDGTTYQIQCPRLTQVCPNMFCPAMCSGKGICDWSLPTPSCSCFDESDTTPGCYDSAVNEQATCPSSSSPFHKAGGINNANVWISALVVLGIFLVY